MGRGRQKAKQTKVARELKYFSPETNLEALQRELGTAGPDLGSRYAEPDPSYDSRFSASSDDGDEDGYEEWGSRSG